MGRDAVEAGRAVGTEQREARDEASSSSAGYDFDRLERAVEFLMSEHERLTTEKEALLEELVERERRLTSLEQRLARERERREVAAEGVDKILGRLEQLQSSVSLAAEST